MFGHMLRMPLDFQNCIFRFESRNLEPPKCFSCFYCQWPGCRGGRSNKKVKSLDEKASAVVSIVGTSSSWIPSQSGTGSGAGSAVACGTGLRRQVNLISTKGSKIRKPRTKVETNLQLLPLSKFSSLQPCNCRRPKALINVRTLCLLLKKCPGSSEPSTVLVLMLNNPSNDIKERKRLAVRRLVPMSAGLVLPETADNLMIPTPMRF